MARLSRARNPAVSEAIARAEHAEVLLAQAQRLARIGSWDADLVTGQSWWSTEQFRLLEVDESTSPTFDHFLARVHPYDVEKVRRARQDAERLGRPYDYLCRVVLPSGRERVIRCLGHPVVDEEGRIVRIHGTTQDVTEQERTRAALEASQAELAHLALHDGLTHLPNRALIEDRLEHALELRRRDGGLVAVLFIDIDRFKLTNDGLGHDVGDQVLVAVAHRLTEVVRGGDTVARFGGDEFVIACEGLRNPREAEIAASRVIDAFSRPLAVGRRELSVSVSVGIAVSDPRKQTTDPLLLIRDADTAMYRAKEEGRNRYAFFDEDSRRIAEQRHDLEQDLRSAAREEQLIFHYQPQFSLAEGQLVGAEALIRWQHPRHGVLAPADFVPLAEECGLVESIGVWGLREGCRQAARWSSHPAGPQVVVNVAAHHLTAPGFVEQLASCVEAARLGPHSMCVELTESLAIPDLDAAFRRMKDVRAIGVDISLDDFGTGYSSLGHFSTLPIDWVKIDQSFVAELDQDPTARAVVESVVRIAATRGIKTVAEGVERPEQVDMLRELGCEFGQGFHFSHPVTAEEFERRFLPQ